MQAAVDHPIESGGRAGRLLVRIPIPLLLLAPAVVILLIAAVTPEPTRFGFAGDLDVYRVYAVDLLAGLAPYRTVPIEYPPLAIAPMVIPFVGVTGGLDPSGYLWRFAAMQAILLVGLGWLVHRLAGRSREALGGKSGESKSLETTVGGNFAISFTGPLTGTTLTALGYPAGAPYDGSQLTYCQGPIGQDSRVNNATWKMACDMTGGSSGGPWGDGYMDNYSDTLRSLNSYGYSGEAYMYGPKFNSKTEAVYNAADGGPITNTRVTGG